MQSPIRVGGRANKKSHADGAQDKQGVLINTGVKDVGSPPLIGCWATTTNGGCHKAMRPGRGLAEWHMLPSWKPPAHPAVCPGKLLWLGLATPRRSALACLRRPEPPTDICSNGHMAVTGLGSIRIQGYVLGGFEILRQLDLCAHEDLQVLAKSGGYRCHQDPLGRS